MTIKSDYSAGKSDALFRIIMGTAALLGVLHIGLYFFREWEPMLAEVPMFVPMIHGFAVLESITIAFLALGSHRALRNPVTYWIGIAFASMAVFNVFYILSWPGLRADGQQIIGHLPGTAAWIITIAQILFSSLLIVGVSVSWPGEHSLKGRSWAWSVAGWLVPAVLLNALLILFEDRMPSMMGQHGTFALLQLVLVALVAVLYAAGAITFTRYYLRSHDILSGYVALDLLLLFYNSVGIVMTTKRYALMWYTSRLLAIAGGVVVLFGLLWAYVRLYQKEQEKSRDLEASIIERKRAEDENERHLEQLRTVLEHLTEGLVISDLGGNLYHWNQAAIEMHGFKNLDECRRCLPEFADTFELSASDGQILPVEQWPLARILRGETLSNWEIHIRRPGNNWKRVWLYGGSLALDPAGNPLLAVVSVTDITERKQAEEALREAKDKLEVRVKERTAELRDAVDALDAERQRLYDVLETLPAYVALLTTDYHVAFANRVFRERFGESNGRRCFEFLFDQAEPCEICETYTVLKTTAPHHWQWTGPDGRNYDIFDFPFTDTDGSLLILEMGIDITERKQAEEALNQTLADLKRSNADLEHFAHVASHDLQEPLRSVATALQMLEEKHKGKLGSESDQLIYYAVDAAKRMRALISDLLAYSRVTTRGQSFQRVDVQEVLNQSILNLTELISLNGTEITLDRMPIVECDPTQLLQIFQNLIGNAVKFGPSESSKVHVSAQKQGNEWVFSVQDNGIGIDSKYFDRIFIIFQQLDKKGSFHGTGMGLAIVKKIVERHRGRVWVESEVGAGSTFYFTIPDEVAV
jgi:PAS domain S-box-containing protein